MKNNFLDKYNFEMDFEAYYLCHLSYYKEDLQEIFKKTDISSELEIFKSYFFIVIQRLKILSKLFREDVLKVLSDSELGPDLGNIVLSYLNYPKREFQAYQEETSSSSSEEDGVTLYIADNKYKAILIFIEDNIWTYLYIIKRSVMQKYAEFCRYTISNPNNVYQFGVRRVFEKENKVLEVSEKLIENIITEISSHLSIHTKNDIIYC